jgi:hypothetical protein
MNFYDFNFFSEDDGYKKDKDKEKNVVLLVLL